MVETQRVYHVTHIRNLDGILSADALRADAAPAVDLSTQLVRELRSSAEVGVGLSVAAYVPFYLAPTATQWGELLAGAADVTRWSDAARAATSTDFVFLVSTMADLGDDVVIGDGDASAGYTRFASGGAVRGMLERLHDGDTVHDAEVLAKDSVPFESIQLIGVANDRVRDRVRDITAKKVVVYPPWFQLP